MAEGKALIKAGCCGFRMARSEYAKQFRVVEVQQTFYQPPKIETLERWRTEVPNEFEFTLKAWQLITHEARSPTYRRLKRELSEDERQECGAFKPTKIVQEAWATTLACAKALRAMRVLFQCPATFTPSTRHIKDLRQFFSSIERSSELICLWEPRGEWHAELIHELCLELDLIHVVDPFVTRTVTPKRCYYRLHGRGGWGYKYEDDELAELLSMLPRETVSYVLFNNVRMVQDAARFRALAKKRLRT